MSKFQLIALGASLMFLFDACVDLYTECIMDQAASEIKKSN